MSAASVSLGPRQRLLRQVRRTRRRALWLGCSRVALAVAVVLAAVPVVSTLFLGWLPAAWRPTAAAIWLLGGVGLAGWLARDQWRRSRPRLDPAAASELLAAGNDGELLVTGVDLAAWGEGGAVSRGVSPALADAQVDQAAACAATRSPAVSLPAEPLWRWTGGALLAGLLLAGWVGWNPGGTRDVWAALFRGGEPPPVTVGNLQLDLAPPAYTGLSATRVDGADGAVHGYPGSRVTLAGRLSRAVTSGQWEGPGGEVVALQLVGERFTAEWLLQRAGTYRLAFFDGRQAVANDFMPRPQSLMDDQRPQVSMTAPDSDLEVTSDQEVELVFRATDDFRVERVELVASGDTELRIPVASQPGPAAEGSVRFLPLAHPELGEGAHLRIEAWDNDTVGGPKVGVGPSVYVAFLDKRRLLADIEGLQERLFEGLILHLADHLEAGQGAEPGLPTPDLQPLRNRAGDLLVLLDRLVEQVQRGADEGALAALAVLRIEQGLRGVLVPFIAGVGEPERIVAELERDILFLDRLLQSLRMEQALSLGDEVSSLQRDLFDALQRGTAPEDLVEEVARIQQLLAEMASQLSRGASEMPDSFANADAVQNMPVSETQDLLQQLSDALQAGDRDAAQELAAQLLEALSQWMAALEEAAGAASQGQLDPLLQELADLEQDTSGLMADQEVLLGETREVGQRASSRAEEALQQELESFLERQERRIREVEHQGRVMETLAPRLGFHGGLPPDGRPQTSAEAGAERLQILEARRRVGAAANEVRSALREDLGQARHGADALQQAIEDLSRGVAGILGDDSPRSQALDEAREVAGENLEELLAELDALADRRLAGLQPGDRGQLQGQGERQGELAGRAGELAERLAQLAQQTLLFGEEAAESARGAQGSMQGAGSSLGQGDPFGAVPQQGRALEQLAELSQRLQSARQQMQQGMQGQGMQIVRSPGQRPGGGQDVDRSRVDIPREMEARELRAFREEVLRAMREGRYPEEYREDVERYYEGLIR